MNHLGPCNTVIDAPPPLLCSVTTLSIPPLSHFFDQPKKKKVTCFCQKSMANVFILISLFFLFLLGSIANLVLVIVFSYVMCTTTIIMLFDETNKQTRSETFVRIFRYRLEDFFHCNVTLRRVDLPLSNPCVCFFWFVAKAEN